MWGKKKRDTDTTIKRTTKIKESYITPSSNINPEIVVFTKSKVNNLEQTFSQDQNKASKIHE
jgi:hypothetical protein